MITNLDPRAAQFIVDVSRIQDRIAQANSQVSSGKKIMVASDAPDQIGALLQLRADQQRNTQIQSNIALGTTDVNAADDSLAASIHLMDTAVSLAAQGAPDTTDAQSRVSLADQIQAIMQQMVSNSQTSVQGRFIFSGDQDGAPAYTWDSVTNSIAVGQVNPQATRRMEDPAGGSFPVSKTAQEIFDHQDPVNGGPATDNVYNALNQLQIALRNDSTSGITDAITLVKASSDYLNSMESFYGNVQTRIQNASDFASQYDVQLKTEISQIEDADITSAAIEMTQSNTQLQAAFQMRGQMPHSSLFNYLG